MFGFTRLTACSTSQGGVIGLARAMAADYGPLHIRVDAVVPRNNRHAHECGRTGGSRHARPLWRYRAGWRLGQPKNLAGIAVFPASEDSEYCIGGIFTVDGGLTAV